MSLVRRQRRVPSAWGAASAGAAPPPLHLLAEIEVARRLLLEPEPIVLRRVLKELRRLLQHVLVLTRLALGALRRLPRRRLVDVRVLDGRVPDRRVVDGCGLERRVRRRGRRLRPLAEDRIGRVLLAADVVVVGERRMLLVAMV